MTTLKTRRGISLLAVIAVAAGAAAVPGIATAAPTASAFGVVATAPQLPSLVDLDANKTGSITIHKLVKDDTNGTTEGTGLEDTTASGTPLDGAEFTVERLTNIDLTTQAGWEKLVGYNGNVDTAKADGVDAAIKKTTAGGGLAKFDSLPLGAYVVTETKTPAGYIGSKPFIITVPMTHPTQKNVWNYDLHVYPKNSKAGVDKQVKDDTTPAVGSEINYTINSDIPSLPAGDKLKTYMVADQYDKRVTIATSDVTLALSDGTALVAGTDYDLKTATGAGATKDYKFITAVFTEAGRNKIAAARAAGTDATKVVMKLKGTVTGPLSGNGLVPNKVTLIPNTPANPWDPESGTTPPPEYPHSEVVSKFGKVKITKVSAADPTAKLKDAEFSVYKCTPTGLTSGTDNFVSTNATLGQKITVDGKDTFTTDADGVVEIDSLRNNDWENNKQVDNPGWYCLVETKAPAGFELQTRPIAFQILQSNSKADNQYTLETTVKDAPHNGGFRLPVTGAAGVGVLIAAGSALVAGAGAIAIANKRRKENA